MNTRIRELRIALGLSQREFAKKIGLKQNAISLMEKADGRITEQNIRSICLEYSVNEVWLRTGEGEMFLVNTLLQKQLLSIFDELAPPFQDHLISDASNLLDLQARLSAAKGDIGSSAVSHKKNM